MPATLWKGYLSFGLISIPIKLFRAARAEKIHMHNLQRHTGARVRQVLVAEEPFTEPEEEIAPVPPRPVRLVQERFASTPPVSMEAAQSVPAVPAAPSEVRAVPRTELVRGFEYEKGKYVEFEREELENIAPRSSSEMQIVEFVRFAEVDPVYLENSYYVFADKGGEKPYAMLFAALQKTGLSAIAEFVMHRRDQTIVLRTGSHGIIGHSLFHEDEVRRQDEFQADTALFAPKEMDLATKLIEALTAPFEPAKFKDKHRENLQSAIARKLENGSVAEPKAAVDRQPVIDIMAALKESLKQVKKPAASEGKRPEDVSTGRKKRAAGG